jgi:hypothetical protein
MRSHTIGDVQWPVWLVPAAGGQPAGPRYLSEFGYGCYVPLAKTTLEGTPDSLGAVSEELLISWARQAMQPRPRRRC